MGLIPWEEIKKVFDNLMEDNQVCNIYERVITKTDTGEATEEIVLKASNIKCVFINNSGNANIYAAGIINNAVIINSSHSCFLKPLTDFDIQANRHIVEVEGVKYNINFVNDFGNMHFGLQLNCEKISTGISNE